MKEDYSTETESSSLIPEGIDYSDRTHGRSQAEAIGTRSTIYDQEDVPRDPFIEEHALGLALYQDTEERCLYLLDHNLIHTRRNLDLLRSIQAFLAENNGTWDEFKFISRRHYPESWKPAQIPALKEAHSEEVGSGNIVISATWEPTLDALRDTTRRRGFHQLANQIHVYSRSPRNAESFDALAKVFTEIEALEMAYYKPDQSLIKPADSFIEEDIAEAPTLIEGMLRKQEKMIISGPSKAGKSWALIEMFISMGGGFEFWGKQCNKATLLFINLELRPKTMQRRLCQVMREKERLGMDPGMPAGCHVLNMREWIASNAQKDPFEFIETQVKRSRIKFDGIFIDPIYKTYGKRSENDLSDMAELWGRIEALGNSLGAAMIISHHFAKGSAAAKALIDRTSGSGGHARDPDVFLAMTPHEDEGCYAIEAEFRDQPPMPAFVVEWEWPLMTPVDKDPSKLRGNGGRKSEYDPAQVLEHLPTNGTGLKRKEWQKLVTDEEGMSKGTFDKLVKSLNESGAIHRSKPDQLWYRSNKKDS